MQIEIYNPTSGQPLPPVQWNFEELKKQLSLSLEAYKGRVYTEDQIALAKKDRALLNKLADAVDAKRKELKALYLQPYELFESQAKELIAMVKEQSKEIDAQVKAYDAFRKEEKQAAIHSLYEAMIGDLAPLVPYARLHDPRWLNVTTSMAAVSESLGAKIDRLISGLASIDKLDLEPDIAEQVKDAFLQNLDLAAALAEKERIERRRAELARYEAAKAAAQADEPPTGTISPPSNKNGLNRPQPRDASQGGADRAPADLIELDFRVWCSREQMMALREFLTANGIKYGRVLQ